MFAYFKKLSNCQTASESALNLTLVNPILFKQRDKCPPPMPGFQCDIAAAIILERWLQVN